MSVCRIQPQRSEKCKC